MRPAGPLPAAWAGRRTLVAFMIATSVMLVGAGGPFLKGSMLHGVMRPAAAYNRGQAGACMRRGQTRVPSGVISWDKPSRCKSVQCRWQQRQEASCDMVSTWLLTAAAIAAIQT